MCVKLPPGELNFDFCPPPSPHPISIYTCEVTTAPRVCGGVSDRLLLMDTLKSGGATLKIKLHKYHEL